MPIKFLLLTSIFATIVCVEFDAQNNKTRFAKKIERTNLKNWKKMKKDIYVRCLNIIKKIPKHSSRNNKAIIVMKVQFFLPYDCKSCVRSKVDQSHQYNLHYSERFSVPLACKVV